MHDSALSLLGSQSQYNNGASSSTIICQLCSKPGHSPTTCAYKNTKLVSLAKFVIKTNHTAKTCFFRNKAPNFAPQLAAMNTTYSRIMSSTSMNLTMNSHMPNTLSNVISLTMNTSMSEPTSSQYSPRVWLTYCWATNHMTTYMRNFSLATPYPMNDLV